MQFKFITLFISFILLVGSVSDAQIVHGNVVEETSGHPIGNVSVGVRGTPGGTKTNNDGSFSIGVSSLNDVLVFTSVGYEDKTVALEGRKELRVSLTRQTFEMEEVVVSGYQTLKRSDVTGSIATLSKRDLGQISTLSAGNPIEAIQGRLPGVTILANGDPTGAPVVRIRGMNTLNDNNPLYVIDGMPTRAQDVIQLINPMDIESMEVLKDGMSAAIYGSRASNGVILITTKKARSNTFNIEYGSNFSLTDWNTKPALLNTEGRARAQWQAAINDGVDPNTISNIHYDWTANPDGTATLNDIVFPAELAPGYKVSDTYWPDVISRKGFVQNHSLLVSSGSDRGGMVMSARYYNDQYVLKYKDYEKVSARINSNYFLTKDHRIEVGENIAFTSDRNAGLYDATEVIVGTYSLRPILPVYTESGGFSGPPNGFFADNINPLMRLYNGREDQVKTLYMLGNVYAALRPIDNLTIRGAYGFNWSNADGRVIQRKYATGTMSEDDNSLTNSQAKSMEWNLSLTAQYNLDIHKDHAFRFLLGTEQTRLKSSRFSAQRFGFATEDLDFMQLDAGSGNQIVSGSALGSSLVSFFGNVNYAYKDKYLFTGTARIDGSSVFGPEHKYGVFPAFSAGWQLSKESFIRDNLPFISDLKLRGGWGETGNQSISPVGRFDLFSSSYASSEIVTPPWDRGYGYANYATSYDLNGNGSGVLPSGFRRIQTGNDDLKWETTKETDLGLDYGFLDNKIFGSFTYFIRNTDDILITPVVVAARGEGSQQFFNGASVRSKGWEIDITYQNMAGRNFHYAISGNLSHAGNKITHLPDAVAHTFPGNSEQTIIGHSINSIFGYVADGLFTSQDELDHSADQPGKGLGRIRYKDVFEDGKINSLDQIYLSSGDPSLEFGLGFSANYKGFNLSFFFQGITGLKVLDGQKLNSDFAGLYAGTNYGTRALDAWSLSNQDSSIPALSENDANDEGRVSSYFLADASYAKLRQLVIGYTFTHIPHINNLNLFIQGENLLTIKSSGFVGKDPENLSVFPTSSSAVMQQIDAAALFQPLPRPRTISIGVNINL